MPQTRDMAVKFGANHFSRVIRIRANDDAPLRRGPGDISQFSLRHSESFRPQHFDVSERAPDSFRVAAPFRHN
jgi:hypothetical protein